MDRRPPLRKGFTIGLGVLLGFAGLSPTRDLGAQSPDFSKGFDLLQKLGLPDTRGWQYVRLEGMYSSDAFSSIFEDWTPSGNGWIEPEPGKDGVRRHLLDELAVHSFIETMDPAEWYAEAAKRMAIGVKPSRSFGGGPSPADEAADVAGLVAAVEKALGDPDGRSSLLSNSKTLSDLFFRAAHWHHRGYRDEAAELVALLLERLPRKQALIEEAMAALADHRLGLATTRFFGTGDWAALKRDLDSVLQDFPRFWPLRPVAERYAALVGRRLEVGNPDVSGGTGTPLTGEQVAWWRKITDEAPDPREAMDPSGAGSLWTSRSLPWDENSKRQMGWQDKEETAPFPLSNGWDWFSVMAAGLGDDTLTRSVGSSLNPWGGNYRNYRYRDLESEPEELSEEEVEETWRSLDRPKTRHEIAVAFLESAIPPPSEDESDDWWASTDPAEIRAHLESWKGKLAGKEGLDLAKFYLAEGTESQRRMAATLIVRIGSDAEVAEIEERVMGTAQRGMDLAGEIVKRRGKDAGPFLEALRAKLKRELREQRSRRDLSEEAIEKEFESYYGDQFRAMEAVAEGQGFRQLLVAYLAGEKTEVQLSRQLALLGSQAWPQEDVEFVAASALDQQDEGKVGYLVNLLGYAVAQNLEGTSQPAGEKEGDRSLPEWVVSLYRNLAEQGEGRMVRRGLGGAQSLSCLSRTHYDWLVNSAEARAAVQSLEGLPAEDIRSVAEERGRARLEGKTPAAPPDPAEVTAERRRELEGRLGQVGGKDWNEFVAALPLEEKLVLRDLISAREPAAEWSALAQRITRVEVRGPSGTAAEGWKKLEGLPVGEELWTRIIDLCVAEGSEHWVWGQVGFLPLLGGLLIELDTYDDAAVPGELSSMLMGASSEEPTEADLSAVALVSLQNPRGSGCSLVRVRDRKGTWTPHEGPDPPAELYWLDRPLPPDPFIEETAKVLGAVDPRRPLVRISFGAIRFPLPKETPP